MSEEHFLGLHEQVRYTDAPHLVVYLNDESTDYPTHWHTALELLMPVENSYAARVGSQTFRLRPGDILLVAPNVYHAYEAPEAGKRYFILIDPSVIGDVLDLRRILTLLNPAAVFTADNAPLAYDRIRQLFLDICRAYEDREHLIVNPPVQAGRPEPVRLLETLAYGKLAELLVLAAQHYGDADRASIQSGDKRQEYVNKMSMVCSYIDDHCTEALSLEQLSGMVNFSKYHFSRLFKEFTHQSFYRYVNLKRIRYAEYLLLKQGMSVTETALAAGYSNASAFIRMFRSINGCTPLQFRDRAANGDPGTDPPPQDSSPAAP